MKKILIVDDEPEVREIMKAFLDSAGNYNIISCDNDKEAILQLRNNVFDLVITDLEGRTKLIKIINENRPNLPIVVATGGAGPIPQECSVKAVILKPFSMRVFIETVEKAI